MPADRGYPGVFLAGVPGARFDLEITDGRFTSVTPARGTGANLWVSPGLVDLHSHLAWTDFHHDDQDRRDPREVGALQAAAVAATLRTGFTTVRDAGGLSPELARRLTETPGHQLRLWASGEALTAADARGFDHLDRRLTALVASGVRWVKVFATGGLGAPTETVTTPQFPRDQFRFVVARAHALGARVFLHSWGGETIDWAVEDRADTVEHGVFLTSDQAGRMADAGVALVPTMAIYQLLADPRGPEDPGPLFRERAARAAEAHGRAVEAAYRAGVTLGVGSDFGSPALHGQNLRELEALADVGVPRSAVWEAATTGGAQLVGDRTRGRIEVGFDADFVVWDTDPLGVRRFTDLARHIRSVVVGGQVVY